MKLWLVQIDEDDWDYDRFSQAAVWAETEQQAEQIVRSALRYPDQQDDKIFRGHMWIESDDWRLHVKPAPTEGIVLTHWHAG